MDPALDSSSKQKKGQSRKRLYKHSGPNRESYLIERWLAQCKDDLDGGLAHDCEVLIPVQGFLYPPDFIAPFASTAAAAVLIYRTIYEATFYGII